MEESRMERVSRFSKIWWKSRADAEKSQEFMALGLGVSKKTVQNWEKGISAPDLFQGSEWFRILGLNPLPYYLAFLFPDLFGEISPNTPDEEVDLALHHLIDQATPMEKRQLLFLMAGKHGSSWYALLQMFTAHCHTSMQCRVATARIVLDNYEMQQETNELVCTDNVAPDLDILRNAIESGKSAAQQKRPGYTSVPETHED
jgi:transcriptional regulator with XRE-family HTH domain